MRYPSPMRGTLPIAVALLCVSCGVHAPRFPTDALGYRFGASPEVACRQAGGEWHAPLDHAGMCNVVPSSIGYDGAAVALSCDGVTCAVLFQTTTGTAGAAAAAWTDLLDQLTTRYGAGTPRDTAPAVCASAVRAAPNAETTTCLAGHSDEELVVQQWTLEGGRISLLLGPSGDGVDVSLHYTTDGWIERLGTGEGVPEREFL